MFIVVTKTVIDFTLASDHALKWLIDYFAVMQGLMRSVILDTLRRFVQHISNFIDNFPIKEIKE